jgi:DNA invertase Pin-like site-specific DNA recombinase
MKEKCAILLVRVSTEIQNYEPQLHDLEAYARNKGYTKLKKIETKESGLADAKNRAGLTNLYDFINKNPEYRTVFATELSRLGRRLVILSEIKEWLVQNRVQLYLKDSGYSLLDETGVLSQGGEMAFHLYGIFAESEIKFKKDRFARAKKMLMEMGLSISGKTLFGYEKKVTDNNRTTLIAHKTNSEIVKMIYTWYLNGINKEIPNPSIKVIALECIKRNYPVYTHSKRNINKLLKEQGYTGFKTTNNKRKNPNYTGDGRNSEYITTQNKIKYPRLIDDEIFMEVQKKLKANNSKADKSSKHTTLLARLIACPICGCHLNADYRIKDGLIKHTYRCSSRAKAIPCGSKQVFSMPLLDSVIWSLIKTDLNLLATTINQLNPDEDFAILEKQKKAVENEIAKIDSNTEKLEKMLKNSLNRKNLNLTKTLSNIDSQLNKLDKEKNELLKELRRLSSSLVIKKDRIENVEHVINSNINTVENSKELLKQYINYFVSSVNILFHNTRYTALRVSFKKYSTINYGKVDTAESFSESTRIHYGRDTFVVIDKKNTLRIRAFKSIWSFTIDKSGTLKFKNFKVDIESIFKYLNRVDRINEYKPELAGVKPFDYKRLGSIY